MPHNRRCLERLVRLLQFQEIPAVSVEILEDCHGAIAFFSRLSSKCYPARLHVVIVAPEIIRMKKKKDAPARLVTDAALLFGSGGFGEKHTSFLRSRWGHKNPPLSSAEPRILDQLESKPLRIKRDGIVIVSNKDGDIPYLLLHLLFDFARPMCQTVQSTSFPKSLICSSLTFRILKLQTYASDKIFAFFEASVTQTSRLR